MDVTTAIGLLVVAILVLIVLYNSGQDRDQIWKVLGSEFDTRYHRSGFGGLHWTSGTHKLDYHNYLCVSGDPRSFACNIVVRARDCCLRQRLTTSSCYVLRGAFFGLAKFVRWAPD